MLPQSHLRCSAMIFWKFLDHQGGLVYLCQWPILSTETWQNTSCPNMGWGPVGNCFPQPQVIHYHHSPQWASAPTYGGHTQIHHTGKYCPLLVVSIHPCSPILAPVYIRHELVPYMVSLGFGKYNIFPDLMKPFQVGITKSLSYRLSHIFCFSIQGAHINIALLC